MSKYKYKTTGNIGLFDQETISEKLSSLGNPLEKLNGVIDFEMFRKELEENMLNTNKKSTAGCKPYDVVMMFKIILLKRFYNLSDEQTEYQINDRLSFKDFLGLSSGDNIPDARSIWLFQDRMIKVELDEKLFLQFNSYLNDLGLLVNSGKIVDASFVEVPRQRNNRQENAKIKNGEGNELWNDKPYKKRQKDIDARWTRKAGERHYGYKNHIKIDSGSKLIEKYLVTSADIHDSQVLDDLADEKDSNQELYADSAYIGKLLDKKLKEKNIIPQIIERAFRDNPLTNKQKENNRIKSKTRCRVEHAFGFVTNSMNDFKIRSIGLRKAKGIIGLVNLVYNMCRYEQIIRLNLLSIKN